MANTGTYKHLPWPDNLWKELFGFGEYSKPPEDWEQSLQIFMDRLSDLEQRILLAWYRDKKTGKQMQAEFNFPGVISKRVAIINQMRRDWENRLIYQYGWAKLRLVPGIRRGLKDALGMSPNAAEDLIDEILTSTTIAQMTSIEQMISTLPYADPENRYKVESFLNEYGLSTLSTRKITHFDFQRDVLLNDALEIIQQMSNCEAFVKRITDTLWKAITNHQNTRKVIPALRAEDPDMFIKALTGGDRLDLLCKAGVVKLHQSETERSMWAVVQFANTLPPITEEEQI